VLSRLSRAELLRASAGALVALPSLDLRALGRSLDAVAAPADDVQRFVSRPDLAPPRLTVTRSARTSPGLVFLAPSSGPGARGAMIVDGGGALVWFRPVAGRTVMDFKVQRYRGRPVLTWWEGKTVAGISDGEWVVVDDTYRELARFRAARGRSADLHELLISPEDTALVTATEIVPWQGRRLVGGVVQELALPGGRLIREWRSVEHVPVAETAIAARPGPRFDYFHVNSIDVDADGDLIVSARNTWAAYKIARTSGRVVWRLGGERSDFALGPGARFYWQHDVRHHGGGLVSVFDNAAAPAKEPRSRALLLRLDTRRRRATLQRAYVHRPQTVLSHFMGNTQLLAGGHVFVGWGGSPFLTEFARDGTIVFDAALPRGGESYRAFRFAWSAKPTTQPTLVAAGGSLHASWNGATGVASWQLLEGTSASDLRPTATVPRRGFETTLQPTSRLVAVVALDAHGTALGRSQVVST
jgi:hypothetical protein